MGAAGVDGSFRTCAGGVFGVLGSICDQKNNKVTGKDDEKGEGEHTGASEACI